MKLNTIQDPTSLDSRGFGIRKVFSYEEIFERTAPLFLSDPFDIRRITSLPNFSGSCNYFCITIGKDWTLDGHRFFIHKDSSFFTDRILTENKNSNLLNTDKDTSIRFSSETEEFHLTESFGQKHCIHLDNRTGIAVSAEPSNWGAFISRIVPKATLLKSLGCKKILAYCQHKSQREMLNLIGWRDDQIIPHNVKFKYTFDEGVLPSEMTRDLFANIFAKSAFEAIKPSKTSAGIDLFISRTKGLANTSQRTCKNGDSMEELARRLSLKVVYPDTLSAREQVQLFSSASLVVGPSGAGMFNTVFCPQNALVVDIESELDWLHGHANLFSSADLRYGFIFAKPDLSCAPPHRPFEVDERQFAACIEEIRKSQIF